MDAYASVKAALLKLDREISRLPVLSPEEQQADAVLEHLKTEFNAQFSMDDLLQFYRISDAVKESALFIALRQMPKGAHLHVHTTASVHPNWLKQQVTANPAVYFNPRANKLSTKHKGTEGYEQAMHYFNDHPERAQILKNVLSLNEETGLGTSNLLWTEFMHLFLAQGHVVNSAPFFQRFMHESFLSMYEDNVQRVEYKHLSGLLFTDAGPVSLQEEAALLNDLIAQFTQEHPDFSTGFVYLGFKATPLDKLKEEVWDTYELVKQYPKLVLGYDLVGEEETLKQMHEFAELLSSVQAQSTAEGTPLRFFFHAGETVNHRLGNLYDALALGSKRLGHAIDLHNHPALMRLVRERDVLIECCPISNMLLRYVTDLRVHPVQTYIRKGLRVSINSDDPGMFGYSGVTHDFLYATVMWHLGLADLKKLVIDSIECSTEPESTMRVWLPKWQQFVQYMNTLPIKSRSE